MKKTYIMPVTAITKVEIHQILAGSPFNYNGSGDVTSGELQSGDATGAALGRGYSVWDDED